MVPARDTFEPAGYTVQAEEPRSPRFHDLQSLGWFCYKKLAAKTPCESKASRNASL